ncbi:MAG: FAD-binding oxidoreductase [Candidatus Dadabacteria bacterium]|nr:FAD-binding oxidoreductase [Candidatus Dadabacteria bacterium]
MLKKKIANNLLRIVGEKNALTEEAKLKSFSVENVQPGIVLFPNEIEQVSEIMKLASKESISVIPWGSGTKSALGNLPESVDVVISTKNLDLIIEHGAADLVATTQCGITLKKFQSALNKERQFLAIDPPHVGREATVGGIIATNDSGPDRLRYGTLREFLIGLKVVRPDGSIFKGGSKVVKNVAGYDLPKLYVGSLGTLGIIVEATFRLYPVPEYSETYIVGFSTLEDAHNTVSTLLRSDLVITSLEILNPELVGSLTKRNDLDFIDDLYTLAIGIKNVEKAVKDQISTLKIICNQNGGKGKLIIGAQEEQLWEDIRDFPWELFKAERVVCKASVVVTQIPQVLTTLKKLTDEYGIKTYISARAGNGILIISIKGELSSVIDSLNSLRSFVSSIGGHLILQEAPPEIKARVQVWGDFGSGLGIMKKIKFNFDPNNLLNPGRYI